MKKITISPKIVNFFVKLKKILLRTKPFFDKIDLFFANLGSKISSSPVGIFFKKLKIRVRLFPWNKIAKAALIIFVTIYVSFWATFSYQILRQQREDKTARMAVKIFPIPVAYVGGNLIFAGDYFLRLNMIENYQNYAQKEEFKITPELRQELIEKAIFTESLRQIAHKNKIDLSNKEINEEYENITAGLPNAEEAKKQINDIYGLSVNEFKNFVGELALENKVISSKLLNYHIAHILISDEKTANTALTKAQSGEDFAELAKEYSQDSQSRDSGGDIGFVDKDTASSALGSDFADTVFSISNEGEIATKLAKSDYGFHIIKLLEKKGELNYGLNDWVKDYQSKIKIKQFIKTN